jgi:hypothetical protein
MKVGQTLSLYLPQHRANIQMNDTTNVAATAEAAAEITPTQEASLSSLNSSVVVALNSSLSERRIVSK